MCLLKKKCEKYNPIETLNTAINLYVTPVYN